MVDRADLNRITMLYQQRRSIQLALGNLAGGGRIVQIAIDPPPSAGPPEMHGPVSISTSSMEYPQQMVEAIRSELQKRLDEIDRELGDLGVTGFTAR